MEDGKIVELYLERDENAIGQTAKKYGARLRALAFGITADREISEECENDTYLEAWKTIPPNEPRDYFYPFLACITRHISIDRCRKNTRSKRSGYVIELNEELENCLPVSGNVSEEIDAKALGEAISRFLYTLPLEKRVIFIRRYFYFESISDVSRKCSVSKSNAKTMLFRIRRDLKKYLEKEGYTL